MSEQLVQAVDNLTSQTTALLEEYRGGKVQMNAQVTQVTALRNEVNTKATQVATNATSADAAKTAANAAKVAAEAAAATATEVSGLNTVTEAVAAALNNIYMAAPRKADFNLRREAAKKAYAGSGVIEPGLHYASGSSSVNEGLWDLNGARDGNRLFWGRNHTSGQSSGSATYYPLLNIDGLALHLEDLGFYHPSDINTIYFPNAPTGAQVYNSTTGETLDYETYLHPFYGNLPATRSEAVSRAWEGLSRYGDFRTNEGWRVSMPERGTFLYNSEGYMELTDTTGLGVGKSALFISSNFNMPLTANTWYDIEITLECAADTVSWARVGGYNMAHTVYPRLRNGHNRIRFLATEDYNLQDTLLVYVGNNGTMKVHNIFMRPATQKVITGRRDLCFVESWPEKVSTRGVLCPRGLVQNTVAYYKGRALRRASACGVALSYGAFGAWDTSGRDYFYLEVASTPQDILDKFVADPDNHCYYDEVDNELYQWRFRVRTVAGCGNEWDSVRPNIINPLAYRNAGSLTRVMPQGKRDTPQHDTDIKASTSYGYYGSNNLYAANTPNNTDRGLYTGSISSATECSDAGEILAIPILLAQRFNQGAYHPSYNPMGCEMFRVDTGWASKFDSPNQPSWAQPRCPKDTFDTRKIGASGGDLTVLAERTNPRGHVTSSYSGRSDMYLYHDTIYAGAVEDLRISARRQDPQETLRKTVNKLMAGTFRGLGTQPLYYLRLDEATTYGSDTLVSLNQVSGHDNIAANGGHMLINGRAFRVKPHTNGYWMKIVEIVGGVEVSGDYTDLFPVSTPNGEYEIVVPFIPTNETDLESTVAPDKNGSMVLRENYGYFNIYTRQDILTPIEDLAIYCKDGMLGTDVTKTIVVNGQDTYEASRKVVSEGYRMFYTIATGTWSVSLTWAGTAGDASRNLVATGNILPGYIRIYMYQHRATQMTPHHSHVPHLATLDRAIASHVGVLDRGARLATGLVKRPLIGTDVPYNQELPVQRYGLYANGAYNVSTYTPVEHFPLSIPAPGNQGTSGFKALPTLIVENGLWHVLLMGEEMIHENGSWNDDSKVSLAGAGTKTNLNGTTVATFRNRTIFPVAIDYLN